MMQEPLRWPDKYIRSGLKEYQNVDELKAEIVKQLSSRVAPDLNKWGLDSKTLVFVKILSLLLQHHLEWPNNYFLRDDRVDILLFRPEQDSEFGEIDIAIDLQLGMKNYSANDAVWAMTFAEYYLDFLEENTTPTTWAKLHFAHGKALMLVGRKKEAIDAWKKAAVSGDRFVEKASKRAINKTVRSNSSIFDLFFNK